jgi:hypothetical protein
MRKMILIALVAFISISVNAQLANSKWKGVLVLDSPVDVVFDFKADSLEAIVAADNSSLELMQYSVKDTILTIQKISGQSSCASNNLAKYKFEIKEGTLLLTLIEDDCYDRGSVLDGTKWVKQ